MNVMGLRGSLAAGVLAAIGASACCVAPLVLLSLGVGGVWIGNLTALEPYRPFLVGLTFAFFGFAFRNLYLVPQACEPGSTCTDPRATRRQRTIFWIITMLAAGLLAVPSLAGFFY